VASLGPVLLQVVGDEFTDASRINVILWKYTSSTAGDEVVLSDPETGYVLWEGVTDQTNTYLGANFGVHGLDAPNGFRLSSIAGGKLFVYLRED